MEHTIQSNITNYKNQLKSYIETQNEQALYKAEKLSKSFIKNNILPEEIVNIHIQALEELYPNLSEDIRNSMGFLLETMIAYGLAHQEMQHLKEEQYALRSEIQVAANMQNTFLATEKPNIKGLDIGAVTVPMHQMNGDYYYFVKGNDGTLGIAIADVIGKGVPAALCMSMIKYSMDSFSEESMNPKMILSNLNRVVERNVDPNMFITMWYAQYLPQEGKLQFASAGHEPGFYYNSHKGTFVEMEAKGLVLGVLPTTSYEQYELELAPNDMVVLLTDGVTECRCGDRFIETEEVLEVIKKYAHLPAQQHVERVYKHFYNMQDFELKDDFTLIILKKSV
ncbi:PP2C family protein-serine/threonine phosphatase [Virgibacillus sp. W0430]|uniref:PP2C family protein-serine/threonine phosphatase n=1 Tax=Virgibacillus sp. W0430 TaxID=3391580 RepID=UPI003F47EEF7